MGYIKPLYKGDDAIDPGNYRDITVMPCLAKLFNSILNNRLHDYLDTNKIINPCLIDFQPNARTVEHMFFLRTLIEKYACNKSKLFACFVGFAKAFDSLLHSALLLKLAKHDIKGPFYDIIRSIYRENDLHVRKHDALMGTFAPN